MSQSPDNSLEELAERYEAFQAMKLKHESGTDTDVAVITAEDLKWVAESWPKYATKGRFSLEVFNTTGILDRATLEERLGVLL